MSHIYTHSNYLLNFILSFFGALVVPPFFATHFNPDLLQYPLLFMAYVFDLPFPEYTIFLGFLELIYFYVKQLTIFEIIFIFNYTVYIPTVQGGESLYFVQH